MLVTLRTDAGIVQRWIRGDFRPGVFRTRADAAHDRNAERGFRHEFNAALWRRGPLTGSAWRDGVKIADVIEVRGG